MGFGRTNPSREYSLSVPGLASRVTGEPEPSSPISIPKMSTSPHQARFSGNLKHRMNDVHAWLAMTLPTAVLSVLGKPIQLRAVKKKIDQAPLMHHETNISNGTTLVEDSTSWTGEDGVHHQYAVHHTADSEASSELMFRMDMSCTGSASSELTAPVLSVLAARYWGNQSKSLPQVIDKVNTHPLGTGVNAWTKVLSPSHSFGR
ncbi:hypothetical protein BU23DRAFT_569286 [Bimuria novae-zelandiae CBS 107.79]|uniref:Uncharacterized protein n=1 Tax=Bimuria novae-zelandiae CBS 107.79 TaxID=1447943 RepID=A0A6A5V8C8_9PLEO|nr:hypothetical protein BU23DRAFT_569286 [Bimuria novae-zelandiae CBS 107.79]